ncbi:MAG: segregation/condensation protein A [Acidobacteria bacterium]|nr:segregation/condensation protein A [Acidobacteriota bacterium]MCB9398373.1 segregation/condensation protein A [Acidobacteriota bacterium]
MELPYEVSLQVFEGPLDLLLHLIKKNEVDIYDIPIIEITNQYNAYLAKMEEMNLSIAGDFILMASTLVQIKSRTLLPKHDHETEDPRDELVRQLIEHQLLKDMADSLHEIQVLRSTVQGSGHAFMKEFEVDGEVFIEASIYDLISSYKQICDRFSVRNTLQLERVTVTVAQQVELVLVELNLFKTLVLEELFEKLPDKLHWIVTFLALLELVRLQFIRLYQGQTFGTVRLFRNFDHLPPDKIQEICRQFGAA